MTLSPFVGAPKMDEKEVTERLEAANTMIGEFIAMWGPKGDDYGMTRFSADLVTLTHRLYLLAAESQARVLADVLGERKQTFGFKR